MKLAALLITTMDIRKMLYSLLSKSLPGRVLRRSHRLVSESVERLFYPPARQWLHQILFIAGLPKSGTTWLLQLLAAVPGYKRRWPYDPHGCIYNHDLCEAVFATLPGDLYSVVKLHTRFTPKNLAVIEKFKLRTMLMYRDLRAQCVSRYFHVLNDPRHRHHRYYRSVSKEAGISHCVEVTLKEYVPWVNGWLPYAIKHPDRFHLIRYAELRANPHTAFSKVLQFYDIHLTPAEMSEIIERIAARTVFDLAYNLRKGKGTARRSKVGDWRDHLTEEQSERILGECGNWAEEFNDARAPDRASSALTANEQFR